MKTLVLVGNYPTGKLIFKFYRKIYKDYTDLVDNADFVIRINRTPNYNLGTGKKSTILGIVNRGTPASEFSSSIHLNRKVLKEVKEIWFTRPSPCEWDEAKTAYSPFNLPKDKSEEIITFQGIENKDLFYIEKSQYEIMLKLVNNNSDKFIFEPSSGFCLLYKILHEKRFQDFKIYLIGFSWEGWKGHNWKFEKKFIHSQMVHRNLIIK